MEGKSLRRVLCAPLFFSLCHFGSVQASVIISEVYYDAPSSDAGQVFVELYGTPGQSLAGFELRGINGSDGSTYKTVGLSGTIPGDGVFVVADDDNGSTQVANADQLVDVDFQNGPDSIQLWDGSQILDAIGYGDFSSAIFAGEGSPAPDVAGKSLARTSLIDTDDNVADFSVLTTPTPGLVPISSVPLPGALSLLSSGLALFGLCLRKATAT